MTTPFLRLHEFGGAGPVLVLGPSLGTGVRNLWGSCAELLCAERRVIGWELPGHDGAAPAAGFDLSELAAGLLDSLAAIGVESEFDYAGNSIGGAVGLHLLLRSPSPVRAAVLSCTGARIGTPEIWLDRARTVRAGGLPNIVAGAAGRWFAPGFEQREPARAAALLADLAGVDPGSYAAICDSLAGHDVREQLQDIDVPILAVAGAEDLPTPLTLLRALANGVQFGTLATLDDVGHLAPAEAPHRLVEHISTHLTTDRLPAPTSARTRARGMAVRRAVLGEEWVDNAFDDSTEFTADFQDFITRVAWGEVWSRPGLDLRTRSVVTLTALTARGLPDELALHLKAALRNGLTPAEIGEVLLHAAIYCGVPNANAAFRVARRVLGEDLLDGAGDSD